MNTACKILISPKNYQRRYNVNGSTVMKNSPPASKVISGKRKHPNMLQTELNLSSRLSKHGFIKFIPASEISNILITKEFYMKSTFHQKLTQFLMT